MLASLKAAAAPLVSAVRAKRQARALAALPDETFAADLLGKLDRVELATLMASGEATKAYGAVAHRISAIMGDGEIWGGVNVGDRRAIHALVFGMAPISVLEIGTHVGASTIHIAAALAARDVGRPQTGRLTTVDVLDVNGPNAPFRRLGLEHSPEGTLGELDLFDRVTFVKRNSIDYLGDDGPGFDLIFLDGLHSANQVYLELALALRRLNRGGFILLHDYYPDGVPLYQGLTAVMGPFEGLARAMRENEAIEVCPLGNLPWPTKLGSYATSLALVVKAGCGPNGGGNRAIGDAIP